MYFKAQAPLVVAPSANAFDFQLKTPNDSSK
jgi:hypothetical protein